MGSSQVKRGWIKSSRNNSLNNIFHCGRAINWSPWFWTSIDTRPESFWKIFHILRYQFFTPKNSHLTLFSPSFCPRLPPFYPYFRMGCSWKRVENESSSLEYFWLRVDILGSNNLWCDDEYFTAWAEFSTHVTYDLEIFSQTGSFHRFFYRDHYFTGSRPEMRVMIELEV